MLSALSGLLTCSLCFGQQPNGPSDVGIVRMLAAELRDVTVARTDDLNGEQRRQIAQSPGTGFRFEGDFNSDGRQDLILLGQHRNNDRSGSFVLVATAQGGRWVRSGLLTFEQGFIIGRRYGNTLALFFCVGCDHGGSIEWTGSEYRFQPFTAPGVQ